jgi:hypothetical protein
VTINAGAVPLPVRLVLGDGPPMDIGEVQLDMRLDPDTGALVVAQRGADAALAEVLEQAAAKLRKGVPADAAPDPR